MRAALGLVIPLAIIAVVVSVAVQRVQRRHGAGGREGADLLAYLLLALAVGTVGFSLAGLGRAAFPGQLLVIDAQRQVALALAGLVVATPVAWILWRRQARRREQHPGSPGWTVYLALVEAVFLISLVVAAHQLLRWAAGAGDLPAWTDVVVYGAVVAFHEWAARSTPPGSDAAELPRVVGSAIGLVTTAIGVGGMLHWLLQQVYATLTPIAGGAELATYVALTVVGAPVWIYRWWRPWPAAPGAPRQVWNAVTSVSGLVVAVGSAAAMTVAALTFLLTDTAPAGAHFDFLPGALATGVVGILVWAHHRDRLGSERAEGVRAYNYAMAAIGLIWAVGGATALATLALEAADVLRPGGDAVITAATILVIALAVWWWFWSRAGRAPREMEAASISRRVYLLGLGVVAGLTSAGALIASLVIVFQRALGVVATTGSLALPLSLFVFAGLATWHLLRTNHHDRGLLASDEVVTPFDVTIICSHPGMIAARFPKEARVRVVYRNDDVGQIDDHTADAIVETVGTRPSLVWVDESGFRVAPAR